MRKSDPIGLAKAILWEEAKGKLRAIVAADGAVENGGSELHGERFHFEIVEEAVEAFIRSFESDGLHE